MKNPCISIDVSKGKSFYQGFLSIDEPFDKAKPIVHSKEGFNELTIMADKIRSKHGEPIFIFEATGIYCL